MKKSSLVAIGSICLNIVLLFVAIYSYYELTPQAHHDAVSTEVKMGKALKIAIFEPAPHPAIDEITNSFKQSLEKEGTHPYEFTIYNANGNKTLQRSQAEEIVIQQFDLIFTIGMSCTQLIKELTSKKGISTPVVFSAVDDPVGTGIIASMASSKNNFTGITEHSNYEQQLSALRILKPDTKNVLLVYDPSHGTGLEKDRQHIQEILARQTITLHAAPIYNASEIQQKVEPFMNSVDVVLILKDNTIVAAIDSLIRLCNRYGKTLFASDLNSGQKGAALAYGVHEKDFGTQSGKKALLILEDGQKPSDIATSSLSSYALTINTSTMHTQNLTLNPTLAMLLQSTSFIQESGE